jgi:hypothetical protein
LEYACSGEVAPALTDVTTSRLSGRDIGDGPPSGKLCGALARADAHDQRGASDLLIAKSEGLHNATKAEAFAGFHRGSGTEITHDREASCAPSRVKPESDEVYVCERSAQIDVDDPSIHFD